MNVIERMSSDPLSAVCGCFVWIPIAVWVVSIIHWMVSGDIEFLMGFLAICVAIMLGAITLNPPAQNLSPLIFLVVVLTVVMFPMARYAVSRHALIAIDIEQMEAAFAEYTRHPSNSFAALRLAELLFGRGCQAHAVALGRKALVGLPMNVYVAENRLVSSWQARTPSEKLVAESYCPRCGSSNKVEDLRCRNCMAPYVMDLAKGRHYGWSSARSLICLWMAIVIAFLGIPSAVQLNQKSSGLALIAIVAQALIGLLILYIGFFRRGVNEVT